MWLGERGVWRPKSRALCSANRHTVCLTSSLTFNVRLRVGRGPKGRVTVPPPCPLPPGCLENLTHLRPSAPKKTDWLSWASGRPAGSRERRMHACARCSAPVIPGDPTFAQLREAPQTGDQTSCTSRSPPGDTGSFLGPFPPAKWQERSSCLHPLHGAT